MVTEVKKKKIGGLADVVAGDSEICLCRAEDEKLLYRGYSIEDLAANATFEEVAWLLSRKSLPSAEELEFYRKKLEELRALDPKLEQVLQLIPPTTHPMNVLRTGCSFLGNLKPESVFKSPLDIVDLLIGSLPSILLYWYQYHKTGAAPTVNTDEPSHAGHILRLITNKKPSETHRRCLEVSLILYAEHEFNASTFTVRTIASTLSDLYSCICGGIGALRGPLHGGANEKAMELINHFTNADEAEKGILEMLRRKELIMGFGHRVYTTGDPRSPIIKQWARQLCNEKGKQNLFRIAERIEEVMLREKNLFPNLDFYSSLVYYCCDIPIPLYTPLFVFGRITGWSSHLLEQREHNKLIRPISHYTGPEPKKWIPLNER